MALIYIRRQKAVACWINESQFSLVNSTHCEHSGSMAHLCRLAAWFQDRNWATEEDCVFIEVKVQRKKTHLLLCGDCLCLSVLGQGIRRWLRFTLVCSHV